jgi:hypothetical protein
MSPAEIFVTAENNKQKGVGWGDSPHMGALYQNNTARGVFAREDPWA